MRGQATAMREQMPNGNAILILSHKIGQIGRHGRVEIEAAFIREQHTKRCRGDDLGDRSQVIRGMDAHGQGIRPIRMTPHGPTRDHALAAQHESHGAGRGPHRHMAF